MLSTIKDGGLAVCGACVTAWRWKGRRFFAAQLSAPESEIVRKIAAAIWSCRN